MEIIKTLLIYLGLLAAALFSMQYVGSLKNPGTELKAEKINLALRRTGHLLLKADGDTTTVIPPVEEVKKGVWRLQLDHHFAYKDLPEILHSSFMQHGIERNYDVAVIRCNDHKIQAGYNLNDYLVNKEVPCQERETNNNCQYIEVSFQKGQASLSSPYQYLWALLTPFAYFLWTRFQKRQTNKRTMPPTIPVEMVAADREPLLQFGAFLLDFTGQKLIHLDAVHNLPYREAKLLHLLTHANQVLERSTIIEKVWADEGVLVGRSVDMFVSRLRKMLKEDATVQIVAVHGIGYRLEVGGQNDSINV
ncbi:MAG: winged helix-turn-helix domain-containing protein [Saprospiraceae bacterium]|nr:winged helix-turn-helix domain-containing protein [Saprospiraceae bacterium]